jgi:predicted phosphate transport protein (TIGR00153 family)
LTPKEPKFFPLLKNLSRIILVASDLLIECVEKYDTTLSMDYFKQIKEVEREGDKLANKVFDELNTTFITPFDREDIHDLASKLDDVTDRINGCARRIAFYKPKEMPESLLNLAKMIKDGGVSITHAVEELDVLKKNAGKAKQYCQELHEIENKADDEYQSFIMNLFMSEKESIEIIKLKEISYEMERATDEAERVGKIIKTIIVKYA